MAQQTSIRCCLMRGGSSKGVFFLADDLPGDATLRDKVLIAAMGQDARQIDGVGGANPLTSKVAVVGRSIRDDADVDYLFAQVVVGEGRVDTSPNCGNMLAAVGPFAIEMGLIKAGKAESSTLVRIHMVNSGKLCDADVPTVNGDVQYEGATSIDAVPGTAAPIVCNYRDVAGATCGELLPTANAIDTIDGVQVTCIDNGMPVVLIRAVDLGVTGYESPEELDANAPFKERLESIRLQCGPPMNLGDVANKVVPKMSLLAAPQAGGHVCTRTFIPRRCHAAIGVLGAVSVATGCIIPGTVAEGIALPTTGQHRTLSIEHPSGEFTVQLQMETGECDGVPKVVRSGVIRTARMLLQGNVFIPASVWDGNERASILQTPNLPLAEAEPRRK